MTDPAAAANDLADAFYAAAAAVDQFRLNAASRLPRDQVLNLITISHTLVTRAQFFTAEAIGTTLQALAPDLLAIESTTRRAAAQLNGLEDAAKGLRIAASVLSLCTAVAAGDPATILAAVQGLGQTLV